MGRSPVRWAVSPPPRPSPIKGALRASGPGGDAADESVAVEASLDLDQQREGVADAGRVPSIEATPGISLGNDSAGAGIGNLAIFRGQPHIARGELAAQSAARTLTDGPSVTSAGAGMRALLSPVELFALSSSAATIGWERPADRRASMTGCRRGANAVPGRR